MFQITFFLSLCILGAFSASNSASIYYWRMFDGEVPKDALVGGTALGYNSYIGRGPYKTYGVITAPIFPGLDYITVTRYDEGVTLHVVTEFIEILCVSNSKNFTWIDTDYESVLNNNGLVSGGFEMSLYDGNNYPLHVGRALDNNEYVIGKIWGDYKAVNNFLYYSNGTHEIMAPNFQVLVYK